MCSEQKSYKLVHAFWRYGQSNTVALFFEPPYNCIKKWRQEAQLSQTACTIHCVSWNLVNCCTTVQKLHLKRLATGEWPTFKVTPGHQKWRYSIAMYHFLLVVYSNNISILHHFQDITTLTTYVTFRSPVEIMGHIYFLIYMLCFLRYAS